jgi:putative toxin-antitoxin system antitoxin component (TIGR02293 family)
MSIMPTDSLKPGFSKAGKQPDDIQSRLQNHIKEGSSNLITYEILGGPQFMLNEPRSNIDYITASNNGIPKLSIINLAEVMDVPMKEMAVLLSVSYKTLGRKKPTDKLDSLSSSLSIEIANTVAKGLSVFESTDKLNRWLQKGNRALQGKKPFDLLNTPTGIKLVTQILGRMEEGVYT